MMSVHQSLLLAENGSYRVNLIFLAVFWILVSSWTHSESTIGFIFYLIGNTILVALLALISLVTFGAYMFGTAYLRNPVKELNRGLHQEDFFTFNNDELRSEFQGKKIPMETFIEAYFDGEIDIKADVFDFLNENRHDFFSMNFTVSHLEFFFRKFVLQTVGHSVHFDFLDVSTTYNIGNDFYNAFLGDSMVYTSAIFTDLENETLEDAQRNKMNLVANKVNLQPGEQHLDIGCGWGTFVTHCAENYGTNSFGVTISQEQVNWWKDKVQQANIDENASARIELLDYREIPKTLYDKITCLEMAEHVGVKNYQSFLRQVYGLLKDEGLFYIQICGLRPSWQYEDFVWGLFMAKYIFPAADASCPINWVCNQLERAGFEVNQVENVSYHYTETIYRWYKNWLSNKDLIVENYDERIYRVWTIFLAWSVIIGRQGTSACYQIVAHKNIDAFDRSQFGKYGDKILKFFQTTQRE